MALEDALDSASYVHPVWRELRLALGAVRQAIGAERHLHDGEADRLRARAVRRIRRAEELHGRKIVRF